MKTKEEIAAIIQQSRELGVTSVVIDDVRYDIGSVIVAKGEVQEMKAEDIIAPMSVFEELTDEDVLYWSSGYYDELQSKKRVKEATRE
jgi:hypothetical protein